MRRWRKLNFCGLIPCAFGAVERSCFMKNLLVLLAIFVVSFGSLYAQNVSDFDIQVQNDGTVTIINYKGAGGEITIPEHIFNMPVTGIKGGTGGDWGNPSGGAFQGKSLTKITILAKITVIEDYTFYSNQLTSVTLPATLEVIGRGAFQGNQLTSITLPANLEIIDESAFRDNKLTSITIPTKTVWIGVSAFYSNALTSVTIPDSVIYIGNEAFNYNRLTNVVIGNGVTVIGSKAFFGERYGSPNAINSITLGNSVKYIGDQAFNNHRASTIVIPDSVVYIGSSAFSSNNNNTTAITIGSYVALSGFDNNFDIVYKNNRRKAGKYSFNNGNWTLTPNR